MKLQLIILSFVFLNISFSLYGQEKQIYIKKQTAKFSTIINTIEKNNSIRVFYNPNGIADSIVEINKDSIEIKKFLKRIFSEKNIYLSIDENDNYFLFKNFFLHTNIDELFSDKYFNKITEKKEEEKNKNIYVHHNFFSDNITIGEKKYSNKNKKAILKGTLFDNVEKKPISQVKITIKELNKSVMSNKFGKYEFHIPTGVYTINISSMITQEKTIKVTIFENGELNIPLQIKSYEIDEITVLASKNDNVKSTNMGFEKITAKSIKELPSILGEKDIVKVALLLPGVQTIGELSSGFNVRGSPSDQNIFYINNLPIYNSSHVFGLFTAFNGDAINEFKFYKNNIPIEYGGHLSSIFDIDAKQGNKNNFSANAGIGPTSARISIEGPIINKKISYLISLRSSYSDWLLSLVNDPDVSNSSISFYDVLINLTGQINKNNEVNLLLYNSYDFSDLAFGIKNQYSNKGGAFKWNHKFNDKFKSELNFVKSQYSFTEENSEIEFASYKHSFELNHNEIKLKFNYNLGNNNIEFGLNSKYYELNTGDFLPLNELSSIKPIVFEGEQAILNSLFVGDTWKISDKLSFTGGLRYSIYSYLGDKTIYKYEENSPRIVDNIVDSIKYPKNEIISNTSNIDYRISGKYQINNVTSIKASYNILHQYIFMLSNTVSVSPTNRWKLSDPNLKPMKGEQISFGFYKNFIGGIIETSIEGYYKTVDDLIEYKDGAVFLQNNKFETSLIQGGLDSYGVELMIKKKFGKLNGWLNYTYSNASVTALDTLTGESNNYGKEYSANYDRPHAVNLTLNYKYSKRISFSTNVIYSTGRPVTYPSSIYFLNDIQITAFSDRNEYRMPDYFRIDFSINIEGNLKKKKFAHSFWSISFYNITSRKNPYSVQFINENGRIQGYKVSILGSIIPSISYNLKLGNYED